MALAQVAQSAETADVPSLTTARKVAAAAAALFGVALFMTVASVDVPHDATNAELLAWWQDQGNRTSGVISGLSALSVAVFFPIAINYLARLPGVERSPQWTAFARSMAAAVSAVWLVTGAARSCIGHLVDIMGEPLPGVDVLRFATALNYTLLGFAGMAVLSLTIIAVSAAVLRAMLLGRWMVYVGFVCGGLMLAATLAQYGAYTTPLGILWAMCLAVAIWRQPAT